MQKAYIMAVYQLMQSDKRVVSVLSDSGTDYDRMLATEMPKQCFNTGIAEQSQVALAAGMAKEGKIPFVYTSGAFLAYRSFEFIRDDVCYQNLNVKIVGMGSGTSWRTLGPSHHTTEDLAVLRVLPNLTILSPATPFQTIACVKQAYSTPGPVYVRLGMSGEKEFYPEDGVFRISKIDRFVEGSTVALFSTGSILEEVIAAEQILRAKGISCSVYNVITVKPLDRECVLSAAASHKMLFTIEEHSVIGGLGGAIAETLAEVGASCKLQRIGLQNCFAKGYGTQREVREQNGLTDGQIAIAVQQVLEL